MIKTKLFAIICSVSSVVVAATTALTLAVSGPRNTQSLHMLSDNEAVSYGITNLVDSASSGIDTVSTFVDTIATSKTSLSGSFTINSIEGLEELSGLGVGLQADVDGENGAMALLLNASLGSVEIIDGTLYIDTEQIIAEIPALLEGIITVPIDDLESDMSNSYLGQMILNSPEFQEMVEEYNTFMEDYSSLMASQNTLSDFEFDYEAFDERVSNTINESFNTAMDAAEVTNLGKIKLNGGSYQGYRAELPVQELTYILRDFVVCIATDEEFLDYMDNMYKYICEQSNGELEYSSDMITQLSASASMLKSMWGTLVYEIEQVIGKTIAFDMYLTDSVELAGFDFYVAVMDSGRISFDSNDDAYAVSSFRLTSDFTGGAKIGDYIDLKATYGDSTEKDNLSFVLKHETNGDFTLNLSEDTAYESVVIAADGSYTTDGSYFDCTVDSLSFSVDEETYFDIGFSLAFQPIDAVTKPSSTPEYNVWEMSEDDFETLANELSSAIEALEDLFQ